MTRLTSVSYTHLDVYKRQVWNFMIAEKAFMQPIERAQEMESHSGQTMICLLYTSEFGKEELPEIQREFYEDARERMGRVFETLMQL